MLALIGDGEHGWEMVRLNRRDVRKAVLAGIIYPCGICSNGAGREAYHLAECHGLRSTERYTAWRNKQPGWETLPVATDIERSS